MLEFNADTQSFYQQEDSISVYCSFFFFRSTSSLPHITDTSFKSSLYLNVHCALMLLQKRKKVYPLRNENRTLSLQAVVRKAV